MVLNRVLQRPCLRQGPRSGQFTEHTFRRKNPLKDHIEQGKGEGCEDASPIKSGLGLIHCGEQEFWKMYCS